MANKAATAVAALRKHESWALAALLVVHVLLGVYYSVAIPIWEAHDETGHYYFVRYLATEHRLPPPRLQLVSENNETVQPPLYYLLAAVPVSFVDVNDGLRPRPNPYMWWGPEQGGYNRVIHDAAVESWPYRGTVLAIHLARWVSVLLGALALVFTYQAGRTLSPDRPWVRWGGVLALAFWPHFRFTTAVINNDVMLIVCSAAAAWLLARMITSPRLRSPDIVGLGAAAGLALLSKVNGLAVLPVVGVVLVGCLIAADRADRRNAIAWLVGATLLGGGLVGWWFAHNLRSGGGLLGQGRNLGALVVAASAALRAGPTRWSLVLPALSRGFTSLWVSYGWGNLGLPSWLYDVAGVWVLLGVSGLVVWFLRRPASRQAAAAAALALLGLSVLLVGLVYTAAGSHPSDMPGRYLLPLLPALCILLALGWSALLPGRAAAAFWLLAGGGLGVLAIVSPAAFIRPAYAVPARLSEGALDGYVPVHYTFGDFAELDGYRLRSRIVDSSSTVHLSLVWRALARTPQNFTLATQVYEGDRTLLGEVHRYPGHGMLPTTAWEPGYRFLEEVEIPVRSSEQSGHLAWVEVSFYNPDGLIPVDVYDSTDQVLGHGVRVVQVKLRGNARPHGVATADDIRVGSEIHLTACSAKASPGGQVEVGLTWLAVGPPDRDYTVSLQLRDAAQEVVTQVDSQPQQGANPTSYWEAGEIVEDRRTLALPQGLPAGSYTVNACLYDLETMQRLPIMDPGGRRLANDEVTLMTLTVGAGQQLKLQGGYSLVHLDGQ